MTYSVRNPECNFEMHRYERKRKADDNGPLKRGQNYGQLSNGYNYIHLPRIQFYDFFSDEYGSIKDE